MTVPSMLCRSFRSSRRTLKPTITVSPSVHFYSNRGNDSDSKQQQQQQDGSKLHATFEQQMKELQEEREAMFSFTKEDREAWATNSDSHTHSNDFLASLEQARNNTAQHEDYDSSPPHDDSELQTSSPAAAMDENSSSSSSLFTHVTTDGTSVRMVDVGDKVPTHRIAKARTRVVFPPEVMAAFDRSTQNHAHEMIGPKGPIFATAKIAGIMAAKKTSDLIPLCHPLPLDKVQMDIVLDTNTAIVECECCVTHTTGVEMEAMTGCSVAALTIYDMVKAVSHRVSIEQTVLVHKTGGKRRISEEKENSASSHF